MNKEQAIANYFNKFGIFSCEENSVPDDQTFPYLTYELSTGNFGDNLLINVSLWDRKRDGYSAMANLDKLVNEINADIGSGGAFIHCDSGVIWIKRGTPFSTTLGDTDKSIRRKVLNIQTEFLTID